MKKIVLILLFPIVLLANIGQIEQLIGKASISRDGKIINAITNFKILKKDIIKTEKSSKVKIIFQDKTIITIGKESALNIEEYLYDAKSPNKSKTNFNFFKGSFKAITGQIGKINPSKFKLKTKTANIGIRGTTVIGNQNSLACACGIILVEAKGKTIVVPAGQYVSIEPNKVPSTAQNLTQKKTKELQSETGTEDEDEINKIVDIRNKNIEKSGQVNPDNQKKQDSESTNDESENKTTTDELKVKEKEEEKADDESTTDVEVKENKTDETKDDTSTNKTTVKVKTKDNSTTQENSNTPKSSSTKVVVKTNSNNNEADDMSFSNTGSSISVSSQPTQTSTVNTSFSTTNTTPSTQTSSYVSTVQSNTASDTISDFVEFKTTEITTRNYSSPSMTGKQLISLTNIDSSKTTTKNNVMGSANSIFNVNYGTFKLGQNSLANNYFTKQSASNILVNTYTTDAQSAPETTLLSDGKYLTTWQSNGQDGDSYGIYAQIFNSDGSKSGSEFQINTTTANSQRTPSVAQISNGNLIFSWEGNDGVDDLVLAQQFSSSGTKIGSEIQINSSPTSYTDDPVVAAIDNGKYVIGWQGGMKIFNNDGTEVSSSSFCFCDPKIVKLSNGNFLITGTSSDSDDLGIKGIIYDETGGVVKSSFVMNTYQTGHQTNTNVTALGNKFISTWRSDGQDGDSSGVYAQIFNNDGSKSGNEFQVNTYTVGSQYDPDITAFGSSRFIVTYENGSKISGQIFDTNGDKIGTEFHVNATNTSQDPTIIALTDEKFIVSWIGSGTGDSSGIYSQIFEIKNETVITSGEMTYKGFDIPALNTYTKHSSIGTMAFTKVINGTTYNGTYNLEADNTAEFVVGYADQSWSVDGETHSYQDMFYNGVALNKDNIDKSKIYIYQGFKDLSTIKDGGEFTSSSSYNDNFTNEYFYFNPYINAMTKINYDTYDQGAKEFNAMKVDSDGTISGVSYSKNDNQYRTDTTGSVSGNIYGTNAQGLGATYDKTKYDNYSQITQDVNNIQNGIQAAYLTNKEDIEAALNTYVTTGYVTQYLNSDNSISSFDGLSLSVDRSANTVSGSLVNSANNNINLSMTGSNSLLTSYYITDDLFGVMVDSGSLKVSDTTYSTVNNSGWFIAVPDKIDSNNKPLSDTDNESSWGYWTASTVNGSSYKDIDYTSTWVSGTETSTAKVQTMIDSATHTNFTFTGHTLGAVQNKSTNSLDSIKLDNDNITTLNFDFGGGSGNFNGTMKFNTSSGQSWNSAIGTSGATASGFSSSSITGTGGTSSISSGNINGSYYGTSEVKSVGGTFDLETSSHKAFGVFKADK